MIKVHIIYAAEDGIISLKCGVGSIAQSFLQSLEKICNKLYDENIICRLSLITISAESNPKSYSNTLMSFSKGLCKQFNGELFIIPSGKKIGDDYFDFPLRDKYANIANDFIKKSEKGDEINIIITNDGIFSGIESKNGINIWIPHSLGIVHQQSYSNKSERYKREENIINKIIGTNHFYVGYISDYVKEVLVKHYDIPLGKLIKSYNGFNIQAILQEKQETQIEIEEYLLSRGIPTDKKIIFSFNRADEYKGLPLTLESISGFVENNPEYHGILIASQFSNEKAISDIQEKLIQLNMKLGNKVQLFLGYEFVLPKKLLIYEKTEFLLNLPSHDFCPLIPYEAALYGNSNLSIIVSDIPCFTHTIKDMCNGFIVPQNKGKIISKLMLIKGLVKETKTNIIQNQYHNVLMNWNIETNYYQTILSLIYYHNIN